MKVWVPNAALSVLRFAFSSSSFSFLASSAVCYRRRKTDVVIGIFLPLEDDLENCNNKICKTILFWSAGKRNNDNIYSATDRCQKNINNKQREWGNREVWNILMFFNPFIQFRSFLNFKTCIHSKVFWYAIYKWMKMKCIC